MFFLALETVENQSEREILENIYEEYSVYVKALVEWKYPEMAHEAEDVVQSVFLLVIKHRRLFLKASVPLIKSLLSDYTKSICLNKIKRLKRETDYQWDFAVRKRSFIQEDVDPERIFFKKENFEELKKRIKRLPYPVGQMVVFKYAYGMKNKEIADIFELSESNVGTILMRTLLKIKYELEGTKHDG